jgi:hypothetical protein
MVDEVDDVSGGKNGSGGRGGGGGNGGGKGGGGGQFTRTALRYQLHGRTGIVVHLASAAGGGVVNANILATLTIK